ncbi:MAG: WD40/YVTN/BNR-like repeat-containing protein, partial [Bryobacteraceae bacterium]
GGIFLSTDGGASWRNVLSSDQHVYDITVDARNAVLYAAGFESSAWRSEDRGQTWQRIRGFNFKWGHRVIPDPADPEKIYVTTFGGSVWHGPAKGDPLALEDIATPELSLFATRRKR